MVDYKNGKIYRLVCNTTGDQYIGSTTRPLSQRLGGHKTQYKQFLAGKIPQQTTSNSILSNNNFEMILIEDFACENKNQLERRERYYIESMKCVNKYKPAQTKEEHKEERKEQSKQYYQENQGKILEERKQHYEQNKEEVNEKHRQHYEQNKEEVNEKHRQHYEQNKEKINEKHRQYHEQNKEKLTTLIKCECGGHYQYQNKSMHIKTKRHNKWATPEI
jgi:hypothetical protein